MEHLPNKRTLESALDVLDSAVSSIEGVPLRKRRKAPVSTPALVSLLSDRHKYSDVDPTYDLSLSALLDRINSFRPSTWSHKPPRLSALACSLSGWKNTSRDRLECVTCKQGWIVLSPSSKTWSDAAGRRLVDEHVANLKTKHDKSCSWRFRGVPKTAYRVPPWSSKAQACRSLADQAINLEGIAVVRNDHVDRIAKVATALGISDRSEQALVLALMGWQDDAPDSISISCRYCGRRALRSSYGPDKGKQLDPFSHEAFCAYVDLPGDRKVPAWQERLSFLSLHQPDQAREQDVPALKYKPLEMRKYVDELLGPRNVIVKRASLI